MATAVAHWGTSINMVVPRTIVYPSRTLAKAEADDYATKLVKYVPAEVAAFFAGACAIVPAEEAALGVQLAIVALGVMGTLGYFDLRRDRAACSACSATRDC